MYPVSFPCGLLHNKIIIDDISFQRQLLYKTHSKQFFLMCDALNLIQATTIYIECLFTSSFVALRNDRMIASVTLGPSSRRTLVILLVGSSFRSWTSL